MNNISKLLAMKLALQRGSIPSPIVIPATLYDDAQTAGVDMSAYIRLEPVNG